MVAGSLNDSETIHRTGMSASDDHDDVGRCPSRPSACVVVAISVTSSRSDAGRGGAEAP